MYKSIKRFKNTRKNTCYKKKNRLWLITRLHVLRRLHAGLLEYNFDVNVGSKNVGVFPELNAGKFKTSLYTNSGQISSLRISCRKTVWNNNRVVFIVCSRRLIVHYSDCEAARLKNSKSRFWTVSSLSTKLTRLWMIV